jgi:hypothetical protein
MEIKHSNWFAAGQEVQQALFLLSDGAFRLYFYLCSNAIRSTGSLSVSYLDLAAELGRSRRSIASYVEELRKKGVCRVQPAVNQHQQSEIEICEQFWPYTRTGTSVEPSENWRFMTRVQSLLSKRACIRCRFTAADRAFAEQLAARAVPSEQIERAIALGCSRKYVSLLNGTDSGLILSFSYFKDLIEEAGDQGTPAGYWDYLMPQLKRLETQWIAREKKADANNASANPSKTR